MIGFSIMMWFVSFVVLMVAISLLRGNISSIHGKVFDAIEDKVGYGNQLGKLCLVISVGVFISGLVAFLIESNIAIICALSVLFVVIVLSSIWFALIQKRYRSYLKIYLKNIKIQKQVRQQNVCKKHNCD